MILQVICRSILIISAVFLSIRCIGDNLNYDNTPPQVSNLKVTNDLNKYILIVKFDLYDKEDSLVRVSLRLINKKQQYFGNLFGIEGATGPLVKCGKKKIIRWDYKYLKTDLRGYKIEIIADDGGKVSTVEILDQINLDNLIKDTSFIYGIRSYFSNENGKYQIEMIKDSLESRFTRHGLKTLRQNVRIKNLSGTNIIGELPGLYEDSVVFIVGAHFDTTSKSPGADDNASGVAGLFELMRILSKYRFSRTIKFIGFDLEEAGSFGSLDYVNREKRSGSKEVIFINYDMIGFFSDRPNSQKVPEVFNDLFPELYKSIEKNGFKGDFLICTSNVHSQDISEKFEKNASLFVPDLKVLFLTVPGNGKNFPEIRKGDHVNFWDAGYKAIYLGDGAGTRNPYYHSSNDKIEYLDFKTISKVVRATLATISDMADVRSCSVVTCIIP